MSLKIMDKSDFFRRFTPHESSYLYEDMLNSTEQIYSNVVPRQSGTTTSLILYSIYKILSTEKYYEIGYITPTLILHRFMHYEFDSYLDYFCLEYNKDNTSEMSYSVNNKTNYLLYLDSQCIGCIKLVNIENSRGMSFDERIYEDPTLNKNISYQYVLNDIYLQREPVKVIHSSWSITYNNVNLSGYKTKYTPIFLFWHIDLLLYQNQMLNTLGKELYAKDCLMKGIYYARI